LRGMRGWGTYVRASATKPNMVVESQLFVRRVGVEEEWEKAHEDDVRTRSSLGGSRYKAEGWSLHDDAAPVDHWPFSATQAKNTHPIGPR
jgi:hypothetical protein